MFDRTSAGWNLSKQSWQVLKLDKELILFPLLSGIACLLVTASFAVPVLALVEVDRPASQTATADGSETSPTDVLTFLGALAYYVANYFVIIFFEII